MKARLIFASGLVLAAGHASAADKVLQSFEGDGYGDWKVEGTAFGQAPVAGQMEGLNAELTAYSGESLACSAHGGDVATGSLSSPLFKVTEGYIEFLIAGGNHPARTAVQLLADGKVVREATGQNTLQCRQVVWDVAEFKGKQVQIRILDDETGEWGVIAADQFVMSDNPNYKFPPTTKAGKPYGAGLIAAENIPGLTIPSGTTATVVADHEHQHIMSPTALTFGEKGEIYVAETHRFRHGVPDNRDHLYWYLDDIASQTTEDRRKMYEKWKDKEAHTSPKFLTEESEIIRVLDKPGADGKSAKDRVFADGFNDILDGTAAGVFSYEGTLYFADIPNIWTLRDKDGDGKAEDKKKLFEGFGVRVSFSGHDLNGFVLGPDGRLYGTLGDRGMNIVTKEGKHIVQPDRGCIFRFDPDGSNFEVVHGGLRNPKELAFDDMGNAFSVDNNSDQGDQARVVYMVDGGDSGWNMGHQALHSFHRQIGLEDHPPNEWMEEKMWAPQFKGQPAFLVPAIANLTSGPSGLTYHPGTGFLKDEVGRFLICDYRGGTANSGIWSFKVQPSGAGMKMTDSHQFDWGASATDVEYSWDGKLYVADFMGGWSSHEDGRIYSVEANDRYLAKESDEVAKLMAEGIEKKPAPLLAKLLTHPDMRVRLRAELALTRRPEGLETLTRAANSRTVDIRTRLHGVWGLGIIARRGAAVLPDAGEGFVQMPSLTQRENAKKVLVELLKDSEPEVKAQAIKVLGESGLSSDKIPLVPLIADASPRVKFFAMIAAGRMKATFALPAVWGALEKNEDPYLRHAGAYAMQLMATPEQIASLKDYEDPSVRMAGVIALRRLKDEHVAGFINDSDPEIVDEVIRAIHDESIEKVRWVVAQMLESDVKERPIMMWRRLLHSAFRIGDEENLKRVVDFVIAGNGSEAARLEALRLLGEWAHPHPVDQSLGHLAPLPDRDPKMIAGVLNAKLGDLIKLKGKELEPALALINKYSLDLSGVSDADLKSLVTNENVPGVARGKALDLYAMRNSSDLASLLEQLAAGKDDDLAIAALNRLVKSEPKTALKVLEAAVSSSPHRQQEAWGIAATLSDAGPLFVDQLKKLQEKSGVSPSALELTDAAAKRSEPEVKAALEAYQKAMAASSDPLAQYLGSLEGGDPKKGGELFESQPAAQCMRCHSTGGHGGGDAGPNLTGVAKRGDRRYLLESLINPGAKVVAGYGLGSATLKGGKSVAGVVIEQADDHVDFDSNGKVLRVMKSDIESMIDPVSPMPPMGALLSGKEIRDIVAWLSTQTQKNPDPKKYPAAEVVKP